MGVLPDLQSRPHHAVFAAFVSVSLWALQTPLLDWWQRGMAREEYTAILVVPPVAAALIWFNSRSIFRQLSFSLTAALIPAVIGIALLLLSTLLFENHADRLSVSMGGTVFLWIAAFGASYGTVALNAALFPLLFLILAIPMPGPVMHAAVSGLQWGSAELTNILLRGTGMEIFREDTFRFALPGVVIEVAEECSGIRSSASLMITSIVAAHFAFRSAWTGVVFALCVIPVTIFKNALRITAISWLGVNVNPDFFYGQLHNYGGIPFSVLALGIMGGGLLLLRRLESHNRNTPPLGKNQPVSEAS